MKQINYLSTFILGIVLLFPLSNLLAQAVTPTIVYQQPYLPGADLVDPNTGQTLIIRSSLYMKETFYTPSSNYSAGEMYHDLKIYYSNGLNTPLVLYPYPIKLQITIEEIKYGGDSASPGNFTYTVQWNGSPITFGENHYSSYQPKNQIGYYRWTGATSLVIIP